MVVPHVEIRSTIRLCAASVDRTNSLQCSESIEFVNEPVNCSLLNIGDGGTQRVHQIETPQWKSVCRRSYRKPDIFPIPSFNLYSENLYQFMYIYWA